MAAVSYRAGTVFDGTRLIPGASVTVEGGAVVAVGDPLAPVTDLGAGLLCPGMIDLQVNGAGGVQVAGDIDVAGLRTVCDSLSRLGATGCLPTLITDTPQATEAVIRAGIAAARAGVEGFLGLHLEGPHLDPRRKGAHDPALIRPMTEADLSLLLEAAAALPALMVTVAPESVSPSQIARLAAAGVVVSLGHSDCTAAEAQGAMAAGARCATHLFNAMSQLGNRAPGLVGAVLAGDGVCGLIADGIHVDPVAMRVALAAKPEGVFLVSDCMALAGTAATEALLGGRRILRRDGRLTLEDGTLAGADLTLPQAVAVLVREAGVALERALAMATALPAGVIGRNDLGRLTPGHPANMVLLSPGLTLEGVWRGGERIMAG